MPDVLSDLIAVVDKHHHPAGSSEVLSALTSVLVNFARVHNVTLPQVLDATEAAYKACDSPARRPS